MGFYKQLSLEGKEDYNRIAHPEKGLYEHLSEVLPKYNRMFIKLDKSLKEGKFDLKLNDKGLPW